MPRSATSGDWIALLVLTAFWGSSFAFTQIALASFPPAVLVFGRVTIAALVMFVFMRSAGVRLPRSAREWIPMAITAVFGNLLPFHLIAWAQQHIDSSTAAILMAINPLFVLTLAHFLLPGARLTVSRIAGFAVGFVGVLLVVGPGHGDDLGSNVTLAGSIAAVGAALSYAINSVYARRIGPINPLQLSAGMLIASTLVSLPAATLDLSAVVNVTPITAAAIAFLGLLSTGLASVLYFRLIQGPGPAFLSLISYLVPAWGIVVGILFLGETVTVAGGVGMALILCGIACSELAPRLARAVRLPFRYRRGDDRQDGLPGQA